MNITHKYKLSVSIKTLNYSKIIGQNANYMITTQTKEQTNKQTTQTKNRNKLCNEQMCICAVLIQGNEI